MYIQDGAANSIEPIFRANRPTSPNFFFIADDTISKNLEGENIRLFLSLFVARVLRSPLTFSPRNFTVFIAPWATRYRTRRVEPRTLSFVHKNYVSTKTTRNTIVFLPLSRRRFSDRFDTRAAFPVRCRVDPRSASSLFVSFLDRY